MDDVSLSIFLRSLESERETARVSEQSVSAAVWGFLEQELAASNESSLAYWMERLRSHHQVEDDTEKPLEDSINGALGWSPVSEVQIPSERRWTFSDGVSLVRDVLVSAGDRCDYLAYAWGRRPIGSEAVPGCLMNTVLLPIGADPSPPEVWKDFNHASLPYQDILEEQRRCGIPVSRPSAYLAFEDVRFRRPLSILGVRAVEWWPPISPIAGEPVFHIHVSTESVVLRVASNDSNMHAISRREFATRSREQGK
jgi:hypothetical protein